MSKFINTNPNKSIYFIEPNAQWLWSRCCMKCHKSEYLHISFRLIKYQQNKFIGNYIIKIITRTIFNINFFYFIFIFYTDIHLRKLVDHIYYFHEKQL